MMENLILEAGSLLTVRNVSLPKVKHHKYVGEIRVLFLDPHTLILLYIYIYTHTQLA